MKLLIGCKAASELMSQRQDQALPGADDARLRLHLLMCGACRNVADQLAFIRRAMRQLSNEPGDKP